MTPRPVPECGTEAGYQHHRYHNTPRDDACKAAHARHNRGNQDTERPKCPCGTTLRTDHPLCSQCRRKLPRATPAASKPRPTGWARQGLVWYPVYEQETEVA